MMRVANVVGSSYWSRVCPGVTAALLALSPASVEVRQLTTTQATVCTGEISGTVGTLVVPPGAECTSSNLVVQGAVSVQGNGTLRVGGGGQCLVEEPGTFITTGGVTVAAGGALFVGGTTIDIGGDVTALGARGFGLVKTPCVGARGTVRGGIIVSRAASVSISGLQIGKNVSVSFSGDDGLEVGVNEIAGTLSVQNNRIVGAESPSIFAVHFNTVGRGMAIIGNDARRAIVPPLVGANTVTTGNLLCASNVPPPTNLDFDVVLPNTVLRGLKLGQCAGL